MTDGQCKNEMELDSKTNLHDTLLNSDLNRKNYPADKITLIEQQYEAKLKQVQVNQIKNYKIQLQGELEEEQNNLIHNKDQIKILTKEIEVLDKEIEDFKNEQQKLKDQQKQQTQQIHQSYNHIEYILTQLSEVDDRDKQIEEQKQQDYRENIDLYNQLMIILRNQEDLQLRKFENIERNKQQLYMDIEQQKQAIRLQQELLNQFHNSQIDVGQFFKKYEDNFKSQLNIINQSIQESREQINQFNFRDIFDIVREQNLIHQEANTLQDQKNKIQQLQTDYIQRFRQLKLKIRYTELEMRIILSKQQGIKQSIDFTQGKMKFLISEINSQKYKIHQMQNYIQALKQQLFETELQLIQKQKEFQEQNYFKILEQVLTYNQHQNELKKIQKKQIQLKGKLSSAYKKLDNYQKKLICYETRLQKQDKKFEESQNYKFQLEQKLVQLEQNHQGLQQDLKQIEQQIQEVQNQEQEIRTKLQQKNLIKQELTQMFYKNQQQQEENDLNDQLLKDLKDLQFKLSVLEVMKRDNILLQSQSKYIDIGQSLINFIQETTHYTLQKIQIEDVKLNNLKEHQKMLKHKILQTQNDISQNDHELQQSINKSINCDKIDEQYIEIDFQLNKTIKNIEQQNEINNQNYFKQAEIHQQVENLKLSIEEKCNSMEHIKLKQEEIQKYIEIIENQLSTQDQLYDIEVQKYLLSQKNSKKYQDLYQIDNNQYQYINNKKQELIIIQNLLILQNQNQAKLPESQFFQQQFDEQIMKNEK